jgi:hypothetical protein
MFWRDLPEKPVDAFDIANVLKASPSAGDITVFGEASVYDPTRTGTDKGVWFIVETPSRFLFVSTKGDGHAWEVVSRIEKEGHIVHIHDALEEGFSGVNLPNDTDTRVAVIVHVHGTDGDPIDAAGDDAEVVLQNDVTYTSPAIDTSVSEVEPGDVLAYNGSRLTLYDGDDETDDDETVVADESPDDALDAARLMIEGRGAGKSARVPWTPEHLNCRSEYILPDASHREAIETDAAERAMRVQAERLEREAVDHMAETILENEGEICTFEGADFTIKGSLSTGTLSTQFLALYGPDGAVTTAAIPERAGLDDDAMMDLIAQRIDEHMQAYRKSNDDDRTTSKKIPEWRDLSDVRSY